MHSSEETKVWLRAAVYGWAIGWAICTILYFIYC